LYEEDEEFDEDDSDVTGDGSSYDDNNPLAVPLD
jgi:hypothetical protein